MAGRGHPAQLATSPYIMQKHRPKDLGSYWLGQRTLFAGDSMVHDLLRDGTTVLISPWILTLVVLLCVETHQHIIYP